MSRKSAWKEDYVESDILLVSVISMLYRVRLNSVPNLSILPRFNPGLPVSIIQGFTRLVGKGRVQNKYIT